MKKILPALLLLALYGFSQKNFAQESKKEKVAKMLSDYFFLERENIHVHLDKSVYTTDEQIWFKGYVFHRRKNVPFFSTVNIYASLIDADGKILETKLLYGNIGSFSGSFKLNSKFSSGKYYLQFYTNWMNNFTEDESSVYEVSVINEAQGAGTALAKADPSKISIAFRPEGGTLVSGVANTIGISIADCNHNPIPVSVADIVDGSGNALMKVQINKKGYGKFELPAGATGCKAIVTIDGVKHEQSLPQPQGKGIALEINNYSSPDKAIVKLRTNKFTADSFAGKPLFILLHQDDQAMLYEVAFKEGSTELMMAILAKDLFEGMSTIRVLDSDLNQLAERLIYKYPQTVLTSELTKVKQVSDTLQYKGKVNYPNMNLSMSVLPENTISLDETNDIYSSFLLLPYIKTHRNASGRYYFSTLSKVKAYELDLYLLSQESKYEWRNIMTSPPKNNYPFDMGLTVKGTVPANSGSTKLAQVRLYSLTSSIDEIADVDDKREFAYNNMVIADSTYVNFTLLRKGEKPKELTLAPQILNGGRRYNKPFRPEPHFYLETTAQEVTEVPHTYKENIELEEVKIDANRLKYANRFGNANLRGYKITEEQANMYLNLLNYIKTYGGGFNVSDNNGEVRITSRTVNSINGAQTGPIVYIDNVQQLDLAVLRNILMEEVDEIYMSPHAIVPSVRNFTGIIRIYLKRGGGAYKSKNATPEIMVRNGFERVLPFENVHYSSTNDKGFENFGLIDWEPVIMTDENGAFRIEMPKTAQKTIKVVIEGFSADGKLVSEIKTMTVN
ncbi:hypothetical protein HYN59_07970 [Flavobacterium album]|uniref:TonB-dependent receptor n=1 Tax=Flavobacterium album TaxID=2175091 RepID=A0A2S1QXC1_9FLAO|nr:hypothetical protein [Flavobacterium album]AWH85067.1 hypothetical protein HYN59_07970 [Flavobacterium album]